MDDLISRQAAVDAIVQYLGRINRDFDNWKCTARIILDHVPSAQPDNRVAKIADLVEGAIDHFDLDDAMDLLYQIKEVLQHG